MVDSIFVFHSCLHHGKLTITIASTRRPFPETTMSKKKDRRKDSDSSQDEARDKQSPTANPRADGPTNLNPDAAPSSSNDVETRREDYSFDSKTLDSAVIALPLLKLIAKDPKADQAVMIDLNLSFAGGRDEARKRVISLVEELIKHSNVDRSKYGVDVRKGLNSKQYVCAYLTGEVIREMVRQDRFPSREQAAARAECAIHKVWPDFDIKPLVNVTISTVKAHAARNAFGAFGKGIVWAVLDSGVDTTHQHFQAHKNLSLADSLQHRDFTVINDDDTGATIDVFGHGTHVAGIIAGEADNGRAARKLQNELGLPSTQIVETGAMRGMAAQTKILSLKVLDGNGRGKVSNLIAALEYVQEVNGYGRRVKVHGVNLSVGYNFEPEWFACGESPLCVELNRLVRTGVVAVVAAGNTGYGYHATLARGNVAAGLELTINDPGNAELAITVGSTHRESPHRYGVSYFSSKGPTGDGRMKPDLVAPGEKTLSCTSNQMAAPPRDEKKDPLPYREDSGTNMAAPHVSGVIAAFLSVRREFIGYPERVKSLFVDSATDLKRAPAYQGSGLVDLMRAIQAV